MSIYSRAKDSANNALIKYGQAITLSHKSSGAYDPATGSATVTPANTAGVGAIFDYGNQSIDGTLIKQGDKQLILSAYGITTIGAGDTVTIGSITYVITHIKEINPAGTVVLYEANLRGAS